jgi:hypothetical protein
MRLFKKIVLITLGSLLSLVLLLALLVVIFEDDIKRYAVEHLNKRLNTRIEVESIDLTLWDKFPSAALRFHNVAVKDAWSTGAGEDTLLFAEDLYLEFDFWDIFSGDYTIRRVSASDGFFSARINADGDGNFNVFKPAEDDGGEDIDFRLQEVDLERFHVSYESAVSDEHYRFWLGHSMAQGELAASTFTLNINTDLRVLGLRSGELQFLKDVPGHLTSSMDINTETGRVDIQPSTLRLGEVPFDISGYVTSDSITQCDLAFSARESSLKDFFTLLPPAMASSLGNMASSGSFSFEGSAVGTLSNTAMPLISAEFSLKNGSLTHPDNGTTLRNATIAGSFINRNAQGLEELKLQQVSGNIDEGSISGNLTCTDFSNPRLQGALEAGLDLARALKLVGELPVDVSAGDLKLFSQFDVRVAELERDPEGALAKAQLRAVISKANATLKEPKLRINDLNCEIMLKNQHALVRNLVAQVDSQQVKLDGVLQDVVPALVSGNYPINLVASLWMSALDVDHWRSVFATQSSPTASSASVPAFNANLDFHTPLFTAGDFRADNFSVKAILLGDAMQFHNMSMFTAKGKLTANMETWKEENGTRLFSVSARLGDMDLPTIFRQFRNFDQTYITDEHLQGRLTANVRMKGELNDDYVPVDRTISATADLSLTKGRIVNLPAFEDIVAELHKMTGVDLFFKHHVGDLSRRLQDVSFNAIENTIIVKNGRVYIPRMEINSNALNLNLSGDHGFDNSINYGFDFLFRDLKMAEDEYTEFGREEKEENAMRIFIKMTGTADNPIVSLDKESLKKSREERRKEEKETLKSLLKEEFGLFRKDSTVKTPKDNNRETEFILYDEDPDESEKSPDAGDKNRKKESDNKKRVNRLYQKWLKEDDSERDTATFRIEQ